MNAAVQGIAFETPRLLPAEDQTRADFYALLARLFYAAPDDMLLHAIVISPEPESESESATLVKAWRAMAAAAGAVTNEALEDEYERLFLGVGRSDVILFGSFYLAGFMNEKPLALLREDLVKLGMVRNPAVTEPEDHLAALCDVMRFLICGDVDARPAGIDAQRRFFAAHMRPWVRRFCAAVMQSDKANFYQRAAAFADAFFEVEIEAFEIDG